MDIKSSTDGAPSTGISPTSTGPKLRISALSQNEIEALQKVFQGTFKLNISETSLQARTAEVAPGRQESGPAEASDSAEQKNEFSELVAEIKKGEYKVGFFDKLRIWVKFFSPVIMISKSQKKVLVKLNTKRNFCRLPLSLSHYKKMKTLLAKTCKIY
jgi:hypothetical protein